VTARELLLAHLNRLELGPALDETKTQVATDAIKFQNGLIQIALAFNYFDPVRAAMEVSQRIVQAIPLDGSPLLQLPGISNEIVHELRLAEKPVTSLKDLLRLNDSERREALKSLDDASFSKAMNIAKQIPRIIVKDVHFKGTPTTFPANISRGR
jgi:preprotein translocase subunit Sec63